MERERLNHSDTGVLLWLTLLFSLAYVFMISVSPIQPRLKMICIQNFR